MRTIVTGHRLTLVDFCHWLVLTFDRGLRRFCSLLSQDMHVHVHVWMFLMRWFYFSEGWLGSIFNKRLGHPIHRAKRAQVITNLKHKVWNQSDMNPHGTRADLGSSRIKPWWKMRKLIKERMENWQDLRVGRWLISWALIRWFLA